MLCLCLVKCDFFLAGDLLYHRLFFQNIQYTVSGCKRILQGTAKICKCRDRSKRTHQSYRTDQYAIKFKPLSDKASKRQKALKVRNQDRHTGNRHISSGGTFRVLLLWKAHPSDGSSAACVLVPDHTAVFLKDHAENPGQNFQVPRILSKSHAVIPTCLRNSERYQNSDRQISKQCENSKYHMKLSDKQTQKNRIEYCDRRR